MGKNSAEPRISIEESILATLPWSSSSFGRQAEIDSFNPVTGKWETIAMVNSIDGTDAEDIADFLVNAANLLAKHS